MQTQVGIIGTGWVTEQHLAALKKIEDVRVAAIAGRNVERVQQLAGANNATAYTAYREMLAKEKLDAVFILLPPDAHGEVEMACAEAVPALLIEKPISNDLAQAEKIGAFFKERKTLTAVGYMNRYRKSVQRAAALFAEHTPILANGWWVTQMPPVAWWKDMSRSGGQFVEQCTHLVDLARALMGEIVEVQAFSARGFIRDVPGYTNDDAVTVNVKFASGAIGNFTTGAFPLNGTDKNGIGLTISARDLKCEFTGWGMELEMIPGGDRSEKILSEENIFEIQNRAFLRAVRENNPALILSDYDDGIRNLAIGLAANRSIQSGQSVKIPLNHC